MHVDTNWGLINPVIIYHEGDVYVDDFHNQGYLPQGTCMFFRRSGSNRFIVPTKQPFAFLFNTRQLVQVPTLMDLPALREKHPDFKLALVREG